MEKMLNVGFGSFLKLQFKMLNLWKVMPDEPDDSLC